MSEAKLFDINEVNWTSLNEGLRVCIFKASKQATMQYAEIQPGATIDKHSHPAEQLTYVQAGYIDLTVDDKTYSLSPGCFCQIPSGAAHHVINRGNSTCTAIDIFFPEREDRENSEKIKDMGHNW